MLAEVAEEGRKFELVLNVNNTKVMRIGKPLHKKRVLVEFYIFENVEKFGYLGSTITNDGHKDKEIRKQEYTEKRSTYEEQQH